MVLARRSRGAFSGSERSCKLAAVSETTIEYLSPAQPTGFPSVWFEFANQDHFWMQWRCRVTSRLIEALGLSRRERLRGLDVGSGAGELRAQLEQLTDWHIDIADLSQEALQLAKPGRGRILYYDVTQRASNLLGSYDVAFLFDVIEHVDDARLMLASTLAHLRPGGHLLVNVPALPALWSAYDVANGHRRRYTAGALRGELAGLACDVRLIHYWGLSLVPLLFARRLLLGSRPSAVTMRSGFQPPGRLTDRLLKALMRLELGLVRRPVLGTSVIAGVRRLEG